MMWMIIFILVIAAFGAGLVYLTSRFGKFSVVRKLAKGSKRKLWLVSAGCVAALFLILMLALDFINAIICILHLVLIWLLCEGTGLGVKRIRKKEGKYYYVGAFALVITITYMCVGWYCAHHVVATRYCIDSDKKIGNLRIVQITDSHIGATFHAEEFAAYMEEINKEEPDIVLITGDFVDDGTDKDDMIGACEGLSKLQTKYGVYFVYGNHDKGYFSEQSRGWTQEELAENLKKNNVVILEDESILIDDRFYIVGRMDLSENKNGHSRAAISELLEQTDREKYIVVMDHQPCEYDSLAEAGVDLCLSGHTHGGQLLPITYVGEWIGVNDKTYGHEKRGDANFIVSSGISDWAIDFKTWCKAEYTVIDIGE